MNSQQIRIIKFQATALAVTLLTSFAQTKAAEVSSTPSIMQEPSQANPPASVPSIPPVQSTKTIKDESKSTPTTATTTEDTRDCALRVQEARNFFQTLQQKPTTAIDSKLLASAKAIVFIDRWAASAVVGGTGGSAVAFKRNPGGLFQGPAFYTVAGGSVGAQVGVSHVKTLALLISDKALQTLIDSKFIWSGNLRAVAGNSSTDKTTIDNNVDVILYQTAAGLDVGATAAATKLIPSDEDNHKYYNNSTVTSTDIFAGRASTPAAKDFVSALNKLSSTN